MPQEQSAQRHTAIDPLFHLILMPVLLANVIVAIVFTVRAWPHVRFAQPWYIVTSVALFLVCVLVRRYALANQDRIIRLEERVRIAALVPSAEIHNLTTPQLIALRFASDAELPALVHRTLAENLDSKSIKQNIATWRPDHHRI